MGGKEKEIKIILGGKKEKKTPTQTGIAQGF